MSERHTRVHSVLAPGELSAVAALTGGGGTVSEFQVSLLTRVLSGARGWYRSHPPGTRYDRTERSRWARAERRVRRFTATRSVPLDAHTLDGISDPRGLLDDHGLLVAAVIAAVAQGRAEPAGAAGAVCGGAPGLRATILRFPRPHRDVLPGAA